MKRRPAIAALAAATAFALVLTGCGSSTSSSSSSTKTATPKFNAANGAIFNPSTKKGGTITYANSGDWDNLDPADTYYGYSWDFIRYYGRSLVMFKPAPGDAGTQLVPDLATSLGVPSDNAKTWTYHIRPGLKYSDGTTITTKDIKDFGYAELLEEQAEDRGLTLGGFARAGRINVYTHPERVG